ncbi:penicillin-binding protein 1C [Thalassospira sp. SN3W]|uniref:penicillin-binding protein 1C n=1 Tax=Thalassospira sp. SN3W TaxID=3035476 RepID=UPI00311B3543
MTLTWPKPGRASIIVGSFLLAMACLWGLDRVFPPNLARLDDLSTVVEGENGRPLRVFGTADGLLRLETRIAEIDPKYIRFLKSYEDRRFDSHFGVDPLALIRAVGQWVRAGHVVSGGSTLTMQVARLLEPRDRTILSKIVEMLRAIQLEAHYSKTEILDMYVTLAPFGGRVEGIRSATHVYFRKEPDHLTIAEAALLTVLPQSPGRLRPDRFPETARAARDKVLDRLYLTNAISRADYIEALAEPLPVAQYPLPMLAPHLAERLVAANRDQPRIVTTIDPALQADLQKLVEFHGADQAPERSVAIMVVENSTSKVRAHLGSRDYLDRVSHGFVDMTRAIRSPGSTLKPFIYALSFDDHQTHPQTMIWDREIADGSYHPTNFDHGEYGQVSIADALRFSLNIPAVKVLERYGPIRFAQSLRRNGLEMRLPGEAQSPNLAMALGGVGVRLEDLIGFYRALAADRKNCPLQYLRDRAPVPCLSDSDMFSVRTQNWITGILQNTPRPAGYRWQSLDNTNAPPIAFKTGTSYGYRDAWAFGYAGDYTVGVWVGKASGQPIPGQTGLGAAAPILFSVFEKLPRPPLPPARKAAFNLWKAPPPDLLKDFSRQQKGTTKQAANGLDIISPAEDAVFLLGDIQQRGVPLRARNGLRPLIWIINGVPLVSDPWKRTVNWMPDAPGFYDITVLDRQGAAHHRRITIRTALPSDR